MVLISDNTFESKGSSKKYIFCPHTNLNVLICLVKIKVKVIWSWNTKTRQIIEY